MLSSTDHPFVYDPNLLEACAQSSLASTLSSSSSSLGWLDQIRAGDLLEDNPDATSQHSCVQLFHQHAAHYGRTVLVVEKDPFQQQARRRRLSARDEQEQREQQQEQRFVTFVESVRFVYQHNRDNTVRHQVTLNQFSDRPVEDSLPLARPEQEPFPFGWTTEGEFTEMEHANLVTRLDHEHAIVQAATANAEGAGLWGIGKGSIKTLHPPTHHHHSHHHAHDSSASSGQPPWHSSSSGFRAYEFEPSNALRVSDRDTPEEFHVPEVPDPHLDGVIVSVKRHHPNVDPKGQHDHDAESNDEDEDEDTTTEVNDDATSPKDGMSTSRRHRRKKNDDDDDDDDDASHAADPNQDFSTHLNWATSDNPDGVPIVHLPFDQVRRLYCFFFVVSKGVCDKMGNMASEH